MSRLEGGCHCGAVRFAVTTELREILDCNCSMCTKKALLHLIVPRADFLLLAGEEQLSTYRFGTRIAQHRFCQTCGIHPFYVPRSHPEGVSVNARCLDLVRDRGLDGWTIKPFDGRHWEDNVDTIR